MGDGLGLQRRAGIHSVCKFVVCDELLTMCQKHFYQAVEPLAHLVSAVVADDKGHLEFGMLFQVEELPRVKIGDEVAIALEHTAHHPVVEPFGQVVEGEPEQGEADERCDGCRNLHHAVFHEPCARLREVHVAAWDECWVER